MLCGHNSLFGGNEHIIAHSAGTFDAEPHKPVAARYSQPARGWSHKSGVSHARLILSFPRFLLKIILEAVQGLHVIARPAPATARNTYMILIDVIRHSRAALTSKGVRGGGGGWVLKTTAAARINSGQN